MSLSIGIHLCSLVDAGCTESNSGDVRIFVTFQNNDGKINHFMSFNGGAKKITLESLIKLGLRGELEDISDKGAAVFNTERKYEVCVQEKLNPVDGKMYNNVHWFNAEGEGGVKRMEPAKAKMKLAAFKGDLLAMGYVPQKAEPTVPTIQGDIPMGELPF